MTKISCAIYTRKSTEEGLEQDFNSLENQYESAKAYIASQKHEGWKFYKRYDDGGFTGANTKRPGLTQLLEDIEKGYVNCVVVYKVDRLSRSLIDFSKMMELFEKHSIGFVSVTQNFNTSNSMGKLTLNVLLSFAQFEREVTAERIRDKISASKRKGMWMGGIVPLGYRLENKKLKIHETESLYIKYIFESYLKVSSIAELRNKLTQEGKFTRSGKQWGHSLLGKVLNNPIYIGKVRQGKDLYEGQHQGLIEESLWQQVQEKLKTANNRNNSETEFGRYLLFQKLYNADGEMFRCDSSIKKNKNTKIRYEYYVSAKKRFQTRRIDELVDKAIENFINAKSLLERSLEDELSRIDYSALSYESKRDLIRYLIDRVIYNEKELRIEIKLDKINNLKTWQSSLASNADRQSFPEAYLSADQSQINILINLGETYAGFKIIDDSLIKAVAKGYEWKQLLESGLNINEIGKREKKEPSFISRMIKLGYLSPKVIESIVSRKYDKELSIVNLLDISNECSWEKQEELVICLSK